MGGGSSSRNTLNFNYQNTNINKLTLKNTYEVINENVYKNMISSNTSTSLYTIQVINTNVDLSGFSTSYSSSNTNSANLTQQVQISQQVMINILQNSTSDLVSQLSAAVANMSVQDFKNVQSATQQNSFVNQILPNLGGGGGSDTDTNISISQVVVNIQDIANKYFTKQVNTYFNDINNTTSLIQSFQQTINNNIKASNFFSTIQTQNTNSLKSMLTLIAEYNVVQKVQNAIANTSNFSFDSNLSNDIKSLSSSSSTAMTNNETFSELSKSISSGISGFFTSIGLMFLFGVGAIILVIVLVIYGLNRLF